MNQTSKERTIEQMALISTLKGGGVVSFGLVEPRYYRYRGSVLEYSDNLYEWYPSVHQLEEVSEWVDHFPWVPLSPDDY